MMATVLGTAGEVYFTAGSGTQLLECAFLNVCGFRSRVVVAHNAYFVSERILAAPVAALWSPAR